MRLRLTYKIQRVPIDYRASFVSLIKEAIKTSDEETYKSAYEDMARFTKPFCFSLFFQDPTIKNGVIEINGLTNLNISMLDVFGETEKNGHICLALFNGIRSSKLRTFPFPYGQDLQRTSVQLVDEKSLEYFGSGTARFKTLSPVFLTNGKKTGARAVLHPATKDLKRENGQRNNAVFDETEFAKSLGMSLKGHIRGEIALIPENLKVEVIQHSIGESMRATGKPLKFVCFSGTFTAQGDPEDLYHIYQAGIGFKRNQGFGMLEVR